MMIEKELLEFLTGLENNNREWFNERKLEFKVLDDKYKLFVEDLAAHFSKEDAIEKVKHYRIYRDIRFSKDKTPFKSHRSSSFIRATAARRGSYFLKIKPGASELAMGFFNPEKDDLLRIRKEIDIDHDPLQSIIEDKDFIRHWNGFKGETLKTAPRNFDKNHPAIELLRRKNFVFRTALTDKEILDSSLKSTIITKFKAARTFLDYMSQVLTTNLNGESII